MEVWTIKKNPQKVTGPKIGIYLFTGSILQAGRNHKVAEIEISKLKEKVNLMSIDKFSEIWIKMIKITFLIKAIFPFLGQDQNLKNSITKSARENSEVRAQASKTRISQTGMRQS